METPVTLDPVTHNLLERAVAALEREAEARAPQPPPGLLNRIARELADMLKAPVDAFVAASEGGIIGALGAAKSRMTALENRCANAERAVRDKEANGEEPRYDHAAMVRSLAEILRASVELSPAGIDEALKRIHRMINTYRDDAETARSARVQLRVLEQSHESCHQYLRTLLGDADEGELKSLPLIELCRLVGVKLAEVTHEPARFITPAEYDERITDARRDSYREGFANGERSAGAYLADRVAASRAEGKREGAAEAHNITGRALLAAEELISIANTLKAPVAKGGG